MRLKTLSLHQFRNFHTTHEVEFPPASLLVAAAPNATGKTNFLEAITVLLRGKSFRASAEECVAWGEEYFLLQGNVERGESTDQLSVRYHTPSHKLRIEENNIPVSPVMFYAHYPYILFLPEDTFMFHRGPAMRRNFLNTALISSPQYLSAAVQYHRTLRQRNAALKEAGSLADISGWTDLLVEHAGVVWSHRESLVNYLATHVGEIHAKLFDEEYNFEVQLVPGASDPVKFADLLQEAWPYEQRYKYTLYGPHRDDIRVLVDGKPAVAALSRGQIRSLVITLKIAVYGFVKKTSGENPILLLDEVLSELDERRQKRLLEALPQTQTLLTCTAVPKGVQRQGDAHLLDLRQIILKEAAAKPAPSPESTFTPQEDSVEIKEEEEASEQVTIRS